MKNLLMWGNPAHPGRIIWVKPKQIERSIEFTKIVKQRRYYLDGVIRAGDWGKRKSKVKKLHSELFDAFKMRFNNDVPFQETEYFNKKKNGDIEGLVRKYDEKYSPLYRQIKSEGFRVPGSVFDKIEPFKVSIASNGDILFMTGKHRLAIANALDENYAIPARVSHRHADWQKYRDKIYMDFKKKEIDEDYILKIGHPDLYDLIE